MIRSNDFEKEVIDRLARIEERLTPVTDHETRIRSVEQRQYLLAAMAAFVGAAANRMIGFFPWH